MRQKQIFILCVAFFLCIVYGCKDFNYYSWNLAELDYHVFNNRFEELGFLENYSSYIVESDEGYLFAASHSLDSSIFVADIPFNGLGVNVRESNNNIKGLPVALIKNNNDETLILAGNFDKTILFIELKDEGLEIIDSIPNLFTMSPGNIEKIYPQDMIQTSDGGYLVTGYLTQMTEVNVLTHMFVIKLDDRFIPTEWEQNTHWNLGENFKGYSIVESSDMDSYYISGKRNNEQCLHKISALDGSRLWTKWFPEAIMDEGSFNPITSYGGDILIPTIKNTTNEIISLKEIYENHNIAQEKLIGTNGANERAYHISYLNDDLSYLLSAAQTGSGQNFYYNVILDKDLNIVQEIEKYPLLGNEIPLNSFQVERDSGFIFSSIYSYDDINYHLRLIKTDRAGKVSL